MSILASGLSPGNGRSAEVVSTNSLYKALPGDATWTWCRTSMWYGGAQGEGTWRVGTAGSIRLLMLQRHGASPLVSPGRPRFHPGTRRRLRPLDAWARRAEDGAAQGALPPQHDGTCI